MYWLARNHQISFSKLPHVSWDPSILRFIPQQWTFLFGGTVIWDRFVSICQGMQMLLLLLQFTIQFNKQLSKQKLWDIDSNIMLQAWWINILVFYTLFKFLVLSNSLVHYAQSLGIWQSFMNVSICFPSIASLITTSLQESLLVCFFSCIFVGFLWFLFW